MRRRLAMRRSVERGPADAQEYQHAYEFRPTPPPTSGQSTEKSPLGCGRRLRIERTARHTKARGPEQCDVGGGERFRQGHLIDVLGRVSLAAHGGTRPPGVECIHPDVADSFELVR